MIHSVAETVSFSLWLCSMTDLNPLVFMLRVCEGCQLRFIRQLLHYVWNYLLPAEQSNMKADKWQQIQFSHLINAAFIVHTIEPLIVARTSVSSMWPNINAAK